MRQRLYFRWTPATVFGALTDPATPLTDTPTDNEFTAYWLTVDASLFGPPTNRPITLVSGAGSGSPPRTLSFDRGPVTFGRALPAGEDHILTADLPDEPGATEDGSNNAFASTHLLGQFVSPPLDEGVLPEGVCVWAFFWTGTLANGMVAWPMLSACVLDASGAKVATIFDPGLGMIDAIGDVSGTVALLDYSGNRRYGIANNAVSIPDGGRIVVDVAGHCDNVGSNRSGGTSLDFRFNGWDENIPPRGEGTLVPLEELADEVASYVEFPGTLQPLVFDAMRDAAEPTTVTRQWSNNVLASRTGSEQRIQLRATPHQQLVFTPAALSADESDNIDNLIRAGHGQSYRVPWWPDVQALPADLAVGTSVIADINTTATEFAAGGYACFYQRPGVYEVRKILSIDSPTQLTLVAGTFNAWPQGTALMPIKSAWLIADPTLSRLASFAGRVPLTFECVDNGATGTP